MFTFIKYLFRSEVIDTELTSVVSGTSIACNLGSGKPIVVLKLDAFAIGEPGLPGAVQVRRRHSGLGSKFTVRGSAACLAAACAPESEASADTEMWIYELTFI